MTTEKRGTKGLELWCRKMTEGYPGVKIENMTTSWRDGLGFCAIIHHFRPDLIDFSKLNKDDIYHNNELAFRIAERHLGIPALLEPEDMVEYTVPDRLSILTYLSQFYQTFAGSQGSSPSRIAAKRPSSSQDLDIAAPKSTSSTQVRPATVYKIRREPCVACGLPVFIAERLNVGKHVYHRTCFRCARCNSQLTLANYYETENNQYCCETCPDEEKARNIIPESDDDEKVVISRSLSDEEKTAHLRKYQEATNSTSLDDVSDFADSFKTNLSSPEQKARSQFIQSQIRSFGLETDKAEMAAHLNSTGKSDVTDSESNLSCKNFSIVSSSQSDSDINQSNSLDVRVHSNIENSINISRRKSNVSNDVHLEPQDVVAKDEACSPEETNHSIVRARLGLFETLSNDSKKKSDVHRKFTSKEIASDDMPRFQKSIEDSPVPSRNETEINITDKFVNKNDESDDLSIEVNSSIVEVDNNESNNNEHSNNNLETYNSTVDLTDVDLRVESIPSDAPQDNTQEIVEDKPDTQRHTSELLASSKELVDNKSSIKISESESFVHSKGIKDSKNSTDELPEKVQDDVYYPEDLNPFGDDGDDNVDDLNCTNESAVSTHSSNKSKSLNPFGDSDDEEEDENVRRASKQSTNPFDEDDDEEVTDEPPKPVRRKKISVPDYYTTSPAAESNVKKPMPTPRNFRSSKNTLDVSQPALPLNESFAASSSSSINSNQSHTLYNTPKKKKPAPKPPPSTKPECDSEPTSIVTISSLPPSPKGTPKLRKMKKAPPPPSVISVHCNEKTTDIVENEKIAKNETNRNKQSQTVIRPDNELDKSTHGKWKRRKGQAPPRPIPVKRFVKPLPMHEINAELQIIEIQQLGLEKQGVKLEQMIRDKCEGSASVAEEELSQEVEDMILQLFELVNEKNELFRKQAELMYLRRQQKLEEEQADIEYQIRVLMMKPEVNITDSDKAKEEELINRLVEIVERRNEIVDCLEMDRVREIEEDDAISTQLTSYTLKREKAYVLKKPKKFKKKFLKEKKSSSKGKKFDIDKDIDEAEMSTSSKPSKQKDKKKKFSLF